MFSPADDDDDDDGSCISYITPGRQGRQATRQLSVGHCCLAKGRTTTMLFFSAADPFLMLRFLFSPFFFLSLSIEIESGMRFRSRFSIRSRIRCSVVTVLFGQRWRNLPTSIHPFLPFPRPPLHRSFVSRVFPETFRCPPFFRSLHNWALFPVSLELVFLFFFG